MIRGIGGRVAFDLFSNFKWVRSMAFFVEAVGGMRDSKWAIFGKQNWR